MSTPTYTLINQIALVTASSTVTFSSIPATYRDLILVMNIDGTGELANIRLRANSDTGSNYPYVEAFGTGSTTGSSSSTLTFAYLGFFVGTGRANIVTSLMDYSATDKHKTFLTRHDKSNQGPVMIASRWANTAAINTINISSQSNSFAIGSTFSLYGIVG